METRDFFKRDQDLTAPGLYQLAAEEAARPGRRTEKSTRILKRLRDDLGLFDAQVREIEALAEEKRQAGTLGKNRKFSRRQLYARAIRYTHWNGDPSPENAQLLAVLREALGFDEKDHENLLERLIDKGWAPPRQITRRPRVEPSPEMHIERAPVRPAPPPSGEQPLPSTSASGSVDLDPESQVAPPPRPEPAPVAPQRPPPPARSGSTPGAPPSREMESLEGIPLNPLETTPHLPIDRSKLPGAPGNPPPPPNQVKQMVMGVLVGALLVAVPVGLWMFAQGGSGTGEEDDWPEAPTVQASAPATPTAAPTAEPPPPPATPTRAPEPPRPPEPPPPPKPADPMEVFRNTIPAASPTPSGGLELLTWLRSELGQPGRVRGLEEHVNGFRKKISASFARRNEEIFEASQWQGKAGGYSNDFHEKALTLLRETESPEEIPGNLAHAYFLTLLAFYMDAPEYASRQAEFDRLSQELVDSLQALPALGTSGAGQVIRVIGEDLRDSDSDALSVTGTKLLDALLAGAR